MQASAAVRISTRGLVEARAEIPFAFRWSGGVVWSVQAAGGPVGGDKLSLSVVVEPGASAVVRSIGAQLVLPGPRAEPCVVSVDVQVGAGATLDWALAPTVLVAGCLLRARTTIALAPDARLRYREELVLGRHGEPAGHGRSTTRLTVDGRPVVHHEPDLTPFGLGAHRVLAATIERSWEGPTAGGFAAEVDHGTLATTDAGTVVHLALGPTVRSVRPEPLPVGTAS